MQTSDAVYSPPATRQLIIFAIPVMLAALATPLMGLVDTAVLGRLGKPVALAAVAVGGSIFTVLYWCFSFLRFTTTGLVAQAAGQHSQRGVVLAGLRPMLAALLGGLGLLLLQQPLLWLALRLLAPPPEVAALTRDYFSARIWSAPFTLLSYAQFAWLLGLGHSRQVMVLQLLMNLLNALLAVALVSWLGWGVAGAGWATAIAEAVGSVLAWRVMLRHAGWQQWQQACAAAGGWAAWRQLFAANIDIMVRTLLLTVAFALMTRSGAQLGTLTLAANQLLLQAFMVCVSLLDGFAVAAEVHGAHAIGAGSRAGLVLVVRRCGCLSLGWSSLLALAMLLLGWFYLPLMTPDQQLQQLAARYWFWLVALPPVCIWAFFWDGVFMGAMRTAVLRNGMLLSFAMYVPSLWLLQHALGNHGVWAALLVLMAMRGLLLTLAWPRLRDSVGQGRPAGC
ncbi:DNA-damage-inducible protein F [Aquitalea magnusonii]|jgi:MATE family multidrug resistance protein|uniref:DNA-damage-inducible protein F n=1 Tax=Aquitalea magnusonii TaxID=332411 RepID=A0A3G9GBM2_9NEIS|nr:MATE family efflux transporter [Aquitalea magnusonii]BBF85280.1 DNA-damage-inducible protein F [Aquitalea magnusonii]